MLNKSYSYAEQINNTKVMLAGYIDNHRASWSIILGLHCIYG